MNAEALEAIDTRLREIRIESMRAREAVAIDEKKLRLHVAVIRVHLQAIDAHLGEPERRRGAFISKEPTGGR